MLLVPIHTTILTQLLGHSACQCLGAQIQHFFLVTIFLIATYLYRIIRHFCIRLSLIVLCHTCIGPKTHWSDDPLVRKCHFFRKSLVRKSVSLVRQLIGPKTPHCPKTHWPENPLVLKPIGPKSHWSEKVSLVRKSVIGPKIAGSKGMGFFRERLI